VEELPAESPFPGISSFSGSFSMKSDELSNSYSPSRTPSNTALSLFLARNQLADSSIDSSDPSLLNLSRITERTEFAESHNQTVSMDATVSISIEKLSTPATSTDCSPPNSHYFDSSGRQSDSSRRRSTPTRRSVWAYFLCCLLPFCRF